MPKLLRLKQPPATTGVLPAEWSAQLFDGIMLPAHARVGLRSLTVPFQRLLTVEAPVAAGDNRISLELTANGPTVSIAIAPGQYKPEDLTAAIASLFQGVLGIHMGGAAARDVSARGLRVALTEAATGFLVFSFQAATVEHTTDPVGQPQNNITPAGAVLGPTGGVVVGDNTWLVDTTSYWGKACGWLRTTLNGGSIVLGLVSDFYDPRPTSVTLPLADFSYYIRAVIGGNFFVWDIATHAEVEIIIATQVNDVLSIEVDFGHLYYRAYRGGNRIANFNVSQGVFDFTADYNPAVSLRDNAARMTLPQYLADQGTGLGVIPVLAGNGARVRTLSMGPAIASLLGAFPAHYRFPQAASGSLAAPEAPDFSGEVGGVLVEIPTFGTLEAYDGATNRRRPIVAAIPWASTDRRAVLSYETPAPVMLDLGNPTPLLLRNLSIRILASLAATDELATLADPATAVLVFE